MDAIFIVRRMQEEYQKKDKKLYMCFVDMEKAFDGVPRKVMDWAMRKKGLSEVIARAVLSLNDGAKTRVRVGSAYSEAFEVKVGVDLCCCHYCSQWWWTLLQKMQEGVWLMNYYMQMILLS